MATNSFLTLAFLSFLLHVPHQAFASTRGGFLPEDGGAPPDGVCSAAVTIHGYKCQEFQVTTDDGYILSVQRIPVGRDGGDGGTRPPVLLQHGLFIDGVSWLMNSPEESLAMILADNGFDEFWNWTWDDLIIHELPSLIDLVFKQTAQKIHYVGHSQGSLMVLGTLSQGKLDNVKSAALLSPIAYISHITSPIGVLAARVFLNETGVDLLCAHPTVVCNDMLTAYTGENCCLNKSTVEKFLQNELQPTATKNMVHFAQGIRDGVLSKYDYGNAYNNLKHYGEEKPPVYDLSKIPTDFPLFLSHGGQDALSDVNDVQILLDYLKSHDKDKLQVQFIQDYAHVDFIMGVNANHLVYSHIIDFFRRHN
ncbi:hypothetical protein DH2020_009653 [Rehmannia glutinosa]|uniref:Lipase n=1 Tax=Rehmannia glutinosa TaxID=99300 RepID=A0ABR0X7H8_REHGL